MKILILISICLAVIHGAPTSSQVKKSSGPLSDALQSSSSTIKPSASLENEKPADDSRRPKMINYYGYYPGYGFGAPPSVVNPQAAAAAFINAAGVGGAPTGGLGGAGPSAAFSPYDFYQFPYGTIAPVYSYNGLLGGDLSDDNGYDNEVQSSANDVDSGGDDYEEDIFSRANRRRPGAAGKGGNNRNSPIFYIRLPPTPYMFIRGLGYISNPPTITPLPTPVPSFGYPSPYQNPYMSMPAANPYMQPSNPFINMPLNFMSNAKPVGVYQYQSQPPPTMRFPMNVNGYGQNQVAPLRQRPPFGMGPTSSNGGGNSGYNNPDSKITHLKGPFIFNGRPEDIYLLQNLQTTPYNANFFHGYY